VRTLHVGLRVSDLERSLAFYGALGYQVIGSVPETSIGHLTMLKLPEDEFVTVELVAPGGEVRRGDNLSHLVVQIESMETTIRALAAHDIEAEGLGSPDDTADFLTATLTDPDGNTVELVQWPPGHADGITAFDWPGEEALNCNSPSRCLRRRRELMPAQWVAGDRLCNDVTAFAASSLRRRRTAFDHPLPAAAACLHS
jgi:lactoylglutathione lyase